MKFIFDTTNLVELTFALLNLNSSEMAARYGLTATTWRCYHRGAYNFLDKPKPRRAVSDARTVAAQFPVIDYDKAVAAWTNNMPGYGDGSVNFTNNLDLDNGVAVVKRLSGVGMSALAKWSGLCDTPLYQHLHGEFNNSGELLVAAYRLYLHETLGTPCAKYFAVWL